jgi:hypothetical protein
MEECGQHHNPAVLTPVKNSCSYCTGDCVDYMSQSGQFWQKEKMLHPPGFETRIVQPVTDYNIWAPHYER